MLSLYTYYCDNCNGFDDDDEVELFDGDRDDGGRMGK